MALYALSSEAVGVTPPPPAPPAPASSSGPPVTRSLPRPAPCWAERNALRVWRVRRAEGRATWLLIVPGATRISCIRASTYELRWQDDRTAAGFARDTGVI